jgi:hypothetical protein
LETIFNAINNKVSFADFWKYNGMIITFQMKAVMMMSTASYEFYSSHSADESLIICGMQLAGLQILE